MLLMMALTGGWSVYVRGIDLLTGQQMGSVTI